MRKLDTNALLKDKEVSAEHYDEMLGCLPPEAMASNAFLVGEPTTHGKDQSGNFVPLYQLYFTHQGKYYDGGLASASDFKAFLLPLWASVLNNEIEKEIDTDHGILRAYWSTLKILIDRKEKKQAMILAQEMGKNFGNFKLAEAMGDIKDAGLIVNTNE